MNIKQERNFLLKKLREMGVKAPAKIYPLRVGDTANRDDALIFQNGKMEEHLCAIAKYNAEKQESND